MATNAYKVEYEDGRERVKLLTPEDAERLQERDTGVRRVTKQREAAANKQRGRGGDKGVSEDNPNADVKRTREKQEEKTERANENTEQ